MSAPAIGQPLPRAGEAYVEEPKWEKWILATPGHGADWRRVFGEVTVDAVWHAIRTAIMTAPITDVRALGELGITCGVDLSLTLNDIADVVRTAWHYESADAAPRLVTAYPRT
jgi:hypothetical protein